MVSGLWLSTVKLEIVALATEGLPKLCDIRGTEREEKTMIKARIIALLLGTASLAANYAISASSVSQSDAEVMRSACLTLADVFPAFDDDALNTVLRLARVSATDEIKREAMFIYTLSALLRDRRGEFLKCADSLKERYPKDASIVNVVPLTETNSCNKCSSSGKNGTVSCEICSGRGFVNGTGACSECSGLGKKRFTSECVFGARSGVGFRQGTPKFQEIEVKCSTCAGTGKSVTRCNACEGKKRIPKTCDQCSGSGQVCSRRMQVNKEQARILYVQELNKVKFFGSGKPLE